MTQCLRVDQKTILQVFYHDASENGSWLLILIFMQFGIEDMLNRILTMSTVDEIIQMNTKTNLSMKSLQENDLVNVDQ